MSLRALLRTAGAASHARLDEAFSLGHNSPQRYLGLIRLLHSFHHTADPLLAAWVNGSTCAPRVTITDRAPAFKADLMALGHHPLLPIDLSDLPTVDGTATLADGAGLALLYVLAGSSLGASVVLRQLPQTVPANARAGLTEAAGVAGLQLWKHTLKALTPVVSIELATVAKQACAQLFDRLAVQAIVGSSTAGSTRAP